MAQVLIRNLDDELVERLKKSAEAKGVSLEAYLRTKLGEIAPSRAQLVAEINALARQSRPWKKGEPTSVDYVREGRAEWDRKGEPATASERSRRKAPRK